MEACECCGETEHVPLVPVGGHHTRPYRICRRCGTGHLDSGPAVGETFDEGYFVQGGARAGYMDYEADEVWHRRTARRRLQRVAAALPGHTPGRLIDVGAATGFVCDEARRSGWDAAAVERSAWAAERCRTRGIRVEDDLAAYQDEQPVDAVTFFQSLEHFPDPAGALRLSSRILRPGGVVVCETWDARSWTARLLGRRWQQLSPPSVLWLFTRAGIDHWARDHGFGLTSWRPTPKVVSLATVAGQALGGRSLPGAIGVRIGVPYFLDDLVTFTLVRR